MNFSSASARASRDAERYRAAMAATRRKLESTAAEDVRTRSVLALVHESLRRRHERLLLTSPRGAAWSPPAGPDARAEEVARYQELVPRLRHTLCTKLSPRARVLIISRGDEALLDLKPRRTAHFPQDADGAWTGFHPKTSDIAIAHLRELRLAGWQYLAIPAPSAWWLQYYESFAQHLIDTCHLVHSDADVTLFALNGHGIEVHTQ